MHGPRHGHRGELPMDRTRSKVSGTAIFQPGSGIGKGRTNRAPRGVVAGWTAVGGQEGFDCHPSWPFTETRQAGTEQGPGVASGARDPRNRKPRLGSTPCGASFTTPTKMVAGEG